MRGLVARPALIVLALAPSLAASEPEKTTPRVVVKNIGMHIGGGPNDAKTKAPFKKAIEKAFGRFATCHEKSETPNGTFGVDLLVSKAGGKAEVGEPRTAMNGEAFRSCVVAAFAAVEFEPPKRGPTRFSYSLRFTVPKN